MKNICYNKRYEDGSALMRRAFLFSAPDMIMKVKGIEINGENQ